MKTLMSKFLGLVLSSAILLPTAFASDSAVADDHSSAVSFNVGYMSEYWYRGAYQAESSMSFGVDYEAGMMYLGMWGADVGDAAGSGAGTEIDLYAGINFEFMVPMYVGVTGYYYTDNFDRDYEEINIGMDFGLFAIDAVPYGSYKSDGAGTASSDYGHFMITVPLGMIDYSYMTFTGGTLHYAAHEISHSTTIGGVDFTATIGANNDGGAGASPNSNQNTTYANFSLGYSF